MPRLAADVVDLILGRTCVACQTPGPGWCPACLALVRGRAGIVRVPAVDVSVATAIRYDGVGRRVILDYKERGHRALARPLGVLLADAVLVHVASRPGRRLALVPVPGHRGATRGFDALGAVVSAARRTLAAAGHDAVVTRLLRPGARHAPLKRLGRQERFRGIEGAFLPVKVRKSIEDELVLIVDDVVTSGATLAEATRVLRRVGVRVDGSATVAAALR